jgi:hypothetical protein
VSWTIARPHGFGDVRTASASTFDDDGGFEGAFIEDAMRRRAGWERCSYSAPCSRRPPDEVGDGSQRDS